MGSTFSRRKKNKNRGNVQRISNTILDIERMSLDKHITKSSEEKVKQWKILNPADIPISNVFFEIEDDDPRMLNHKVYKDILCLNDNK